jgi:hypothetical protein
MGRRIIKLLEDDLRDFLDPSLRKAGYLAEDQIILGFTYSTRRLRKNGDFYNDVINDPHDTSPAEEVRFIKVLIGPIRHRRQEKDDVTNPMQDSDD